MYGRSLHEARKEMGRRLAREAPVDADMVVPVPDTAVSAAQGYAEASGIPYGDAMMKNRYIGRTFIEPTATLRQRGVKLKLNPMPDAVRGRRLVVVDDSIVRGTTTRQLVQALKEAGAAEIHLRITAPPIRWPCFYGIDMSTKGELIAAGNDVEGVRAFVAADSLAFLSLDALVAATEAPKSSFCRACFDGEYPVPIPDGVRTPAKFALEPR
jgi:amidophosphoribosyltransferase